MKEILSRPGQKLSTHIEEVYQYALKYSKNLNLDTDKYTIMMMCIFHDIAKSLEFFQRYIRGEKIPFELKQHAALSALIHYYHTGKIYSTIAILYHHSFPKNLKNAFQRFYDDDLNIKYFLKQQIEAIKNDEKAYNYIANIIGSNNLNYFLENYENYVKKLVTELRHLQMEDDKELRDLISILQIADKDSLISNKVFVPAKEDSLDAVEKYMKKLENKGNYKKSNYQKKLINKYRKEFREEVLEKGKLYVDDVNQGKQKSRILNVNIPTGGGKTCASYNIANYMDKNLSQEGKNRKIIYASSFLSIIHQVYDEYKSIHSQYDKKVSSDKLMSYHSEAGKERNKYMHMEEEYRGFDAKFKRDNWQCKNIVTTFSQIFDSIFSMSKKVAHRYSRLHNSIIILDEVQDIPIKFQKMMAEKMQMMAEKMGCYFIISTATQPYLVDNAFELVSRETVTKFITQMNRVRINFRKKTDIHDFIDDIISSVQSNPQKSHLVCLNTRDSSRYVYNKLKEAGVVGLHLSASTLPNERKRKLKQIKASDTPCVLVCTQIIETGVDVTFDIGFRDFAPLNTLIQFAGRINRHGDSKQGNIYIYRLKHPKYGSYFCYNIYGKSALNITFYEVLKKGSFDFEEKDFIKLYDEYVTKIKKAMEDISE
ncbi:MAG: CRISPR-associated helicase Cas3', partial [bacterium]